MATREQLIEDFADHKLATGEKFVNLINSMKVVQLPVVDPQALGTSLSFIDSISQDADGKITATKKTLDLANAHELNPFKGWYKTGDTLPTDGFDGAYLYFKNTSEQTGLTTIYRWNGTTYADTGTVVDTSNVQTFGSGQAVNTVHIKDENGSDVTGDADVLSAEAGKGLRQNIIQTTATEYEITDATPRIQGYINNSGNVASYSISTCYSVYIHIPEGVEKIKIIGGEIPVYYCGLSSIPVVGESAAFSDGFSERVLLSSNSEVEVLVDSTLKYLYINIKDVVNGAVVDRTPQEISFIHEVNKIDELGERVTDLEENPACVIDETIPAEAEQNHVPSTALVKPYLDILTTSNSGVIEQTGIMDAYIGVTTHKIISQSQTSVSKYYVRYYKLPTGTQKLHFKCTKNSDWPSIYDAPENPLRYGFTTELPANDVLVQECVVKTTFDNSVEETFTVQPSYKYFVVYYVQYTTYTTYVINDVSFNIVKIGLPDVPAVQASDYLGLTQGKIGTNGEVEDDENFVTTDFIKGGGYFHLTTWGDYRIFSSHLYDNKGNLIAYNYLSEPDYDIFVKATQRQSYGIYLMPQWMMRVVICKNDNFTSGNYHVTTGKCLVEDYPIDTFRYFRKSDGADFVVPDAIANDYDVVKYRAMTLYSCIFNPQRDFVASTSSTASNPAINKYYFKKGRQRCGVPYSDHPQYANIPARLVSMRTFVSALANKYSVEYTENPYANISAYGFVYNNAIALARNYFAMACNIFWGYVMGVEPVWNCGSILSYRPGTTIYNGADNEDVGVEPADNVQALDTFITTGHIGLILDVINADGKKYIVTAESTTPTVQIRVFEEAEFNAFYKIPYSSNNYFKIMRYAVGDAPKYKPFDENSRVVQHLPIDMYHGAFSNPDICPYLGDYCSILSTQSMYINVQRHTDKYDRIKVYNLSGGSYAQYGSDILLSSGTVWANDPDGEDWVKMTLSSLNAGKYRVEATNTDGTVTSGFVYFEVIEVSLSFSDNAVTYSATGGTPYLLTEEYVSGFLFNANNVYVAIDDNTQSPISYTKKGSETKLALYVEGDYGVVKKSI